MAAKFGLMTAAVGIAMLGMPAMPAPAQAGPTATFDYLDYQAIDPAPAAPAGEYRNPVLPGFHPDPSIVRVDDAFYLVTSTFSWFPGLPIFRSTDLVNWELIGNAIDRTSQVDFSGLGTNRGLFAPAITHHDGLFWIVNTCIECGGNFVITASDPAGPWSEPQWLSFGGIDPSLVFDDDGTAYIVYNDAPPGEPQYEGHRALWIQQFDPARRAMVGDPTLLVNGGVDLSAKPVWAEGPHIYRVGEWYYLLAAEGGTADQHSQTIYRSRKVTGPYEPGPFNPILTQRDLPADRDDRVEATGHADIVQLDDGSWWGVFLATRPFAGQSTLLGRETFMLPLRWVDGWPRFLDRQEAVAMRAARPLLPGATQNIPAKWNDDFTSQLSDHWIGIRTPGTQQQVIADSDAGKLHLIGTGASAGSLDKPSFIGRRMQHPAAQYETRLSFDADGGDFAGLLAFMDEGHFLAFGREGDRIVARMRSETGDEVAGRIVSAEAAPDSGDITLRMRIDRGAATLFWRAGANARWQQLGGSVNVEPLASVHAGLFTGLVVGPYAYSPD